MGGTFRWMKSFAEKVARLIASGQKEPQFVRVVLDHGNGEWEVLLEVKPVENDKQSQR